MLRTWISRIRGAILGRRMEQEFASEIETHLALIEDDLVRRGMPRERARLEARRQFGGVTQVRELRREGRGLAHLERLWADAPTEIVEDRPAPKKRKSVAKK